VAHNVALDPGCERMTIMFTVTGAPLDWFNILEAP
jgi:hypothetical protein